MAYHMAIFSIFSIMGTKVLSSSSPMKVLLTILFIVWNVCLIFLEKGQEYWVPIFIVMLFNGGLMILFLFTVSMVPKEKGGNIFSFPTFLPFLLMFVMMNYFLEIKMIGEFFFQGWWMILFGSIMMTIYFMSISMLSLDFFKSIKSM